MSAGPTPPPHVPRTLLKAGGSAFFSQNCVDKLTELGFHPDEFGTYDSVLEYIRKCREKVQKNESCTPRERQLGEPYQLADGTLNPLAFQSGHLMMNSTQ